MFIPRKHGFTIVELLIAIGVIGILAGLAVIGYTGLETNAINRQLQSDLSKARDQLEIDYADNKIYPITLAASNGSKGVETTRGTELAYTTSYNRKEYCLIASSTRAGTATYFVTQGGSVKEGTCTIAPLPPPVTPASLTGSGYCYSAGVDGEASITLTWPAMAQADAPNYRVTETGTVNTQLNVANTNANAANLSTTFTTGPIAYSVGGTFTFTVRAIGPTGVESGDSPEWTIDFAPFDC